MTRTICPALITAAACALLAACAQPAAPIKALPPGATPEEVVDYARAQAQYRSAKASGNGDVVAQSARTFLRIPEEILSRQDPRLFDARAVCEKYRAAGPHDPPGTRLNFEPQFVQDCKHIDWRYNEATIAIRRDLEARIAAADLATIAQARAEHP